MKSLKTIFKFNILDIADVKGGFFNLTEKTSEFGKAFQNFIRENLNVDYVLDKISKFGMDSLSEDELNFLKNSTQDI